MSPEDNVTLWEYTVQALTNLLKNNADAGLAISLSFCYHEEPAIRAVFTTIFTNIVKDGITLSPPSAQAMKTRHSYICEVSLPSIESTASVILICRPSS